MNKNLPRKQQQIPQLNQEQVEELSEAFELFDEDGDQMIAAKELQIVLKAIGQ